MMLLLFVLQVAVLAAASLASGHGTGTSDRSSSGVYLSVTQVSPKVVFSDTPSPATFVSKAYFSDAVNHPSGFGNLYVETGPEFSDDEQGFAAGFAEGFLTAERIFQHAYNMMCQVDCSGVPPTEVKTFFVDQDAWIREQVNQLAGSDDMWKFVGTLLAQFDGLQAGYAASDFGKANKLDAWSFTMVNALGDLFDILPAVSRSKRPQFDRMSLKEITHYLNHDGHCSALIKITDNFSDIFVGHSSWFTYSAMLRVYKTYKFALSNKSKKASTISFSSYPGTLSSLDDLYLMGESKMIMTQTTNSIINATLWDAVTPYSLLAWHRVRAANQLADSGPEWFSIVSRYNSGTYNNQYMIVDGKLFKPGNGLQENTLFVVEQIPGMVVGKDVTEQLERGYWSSYNVPYHKEIYAASGYFLLDKLSLSKPYSQYQLAPRASIFRRDQGSVKDLASLQTVMRSNNFQTDPLSAGDPMKAICSRGDLESSSPYADGGYDTKCVSVGGMYDSDGSTLVLQASVVNGPTSQNQPAFTWSKAGSLAESNRHMGQPDVFDFTFETVSAQPPEALTK